MGAWGAGLYSNDLALDLKAMIGAVVRLPFEPARLLQLLCETEFGASTDPDEATTFWLVVADQFAKRGVDLPEARERALAIIAEGVDLKALESLGMPPKELEKRQRMLLELRQRLIAPVAPATRKTMTAPQKLLMQSGDVLAFPSSQGRPINPYLASKKEMRPQFQQDGWGVFVVVECGLVFDFLAWYRPLVIEIALPQRPALADLEAPRTWYLNRAGVCSPAHYKRMELAPIGRVVIDAAKFEAAFPDRPAPRSDTISDISISNRLQMIDPEKADIQRRGRARWRRVDSLAQIASA